MTCIPFIKDLLFVILVIFPQFCFCVVPICGEIIPETNMTADEIISYYGYPVEIHHVQTNDGYVLTLHRIPYGIQKNNKTVQPKIENNKKQVVFLQHGLVASSINWVINFPHQSLGFILADQGYDVWLGNIRGNSYCQEHVNLTRYQGKFWDFSWEDMAEHDLPAMVDYVINATTNKQIVYIGHSQGTLIGFAKFSSDLEFAKKIKLFIAFAPVSTVGSITSPFRYIAPFTWTLQFGLTITGDQSFGDVKKFFRMIGRSFQAFTNDQCHNPFFYFSGPGSDATINKTRISLYLANNPDDTSMKNFAHFGQMVTSGLMQKYNYGFWTNYMKYGQLTPPEYKIENMEVRTVVFWSPEDALASGRDVQILLSKLKNFESFRIESFRHVDFLLSLEAEKVLFPKVLQIIRECC